MCVAILFRLAISAYMSTLEEIKTRIDIVDLVSETVQLRRSGKNYTGFCPFHSNTRTPSFVVFPETGTWRCFGQCNEGGDIFRFLMKKEGWEFPEALRFLAEKAGVQLKTPSPQEQIIAEEHDVLRALLEEAVTFYRHQLFNSPAGKEALQYLHTRNLNTETIEAFGLGYAPNSWEAGLEHFKSKNYSEPDLLDAGLVTARDGGGIYDRFRHRLMFPIRDERERMAGFGARILNPNDVPKFLNSPQTPLFDKGNLLYGLDRARKPIHSLDQAVIVEGYLDVIALHQAGYSNSVSPMGTALTEHQLYLLKRFTRRMVLALDPDTAGIQATLRGLEIARQTMDRTQDPVFDARGLLGHEARLQADIRVTTLPEGMDPDEVVNRDPKEWEKIITDAKPIVAHVMDTLAAVYDLNDPKAKDEVADQMLPLIQDLPSPVERDTYIQRLARLLRVDERTLLGRVSGRTKRAYRRRYPVDRAPETKPAGQAATFAAANNYAQEAHALGVLLRRPELLYQVDRKLQENGLSRLAPSDFQHTNHQAILGLLRESLDQDATEPLQFVLSRLSLPMMEVADELLGRTEKLDPNEMRVMEDLLRALLDFRQRSIHQELEYTRYLMEEAQQQGDMKATQYQQTMVKLISIRQKLDKALAQFTSHVIELSQEPES